MGGVFERDTAAKFVIAHFCDGREEWIPVAQGGRFGGIVVERVEGADAECGGGEEDEGFGVASGERWGVAGGEGWKAYQGG